MRVCRPVLYRVDIALIAVGRGRLKVTDLLGFLSKVVIVGDSGSKVTDLRGLLDPEDVVIEGDSGLTIPEDDGTASSGRAVLMGVPSLVVGVGRCFKMGGAIPVDEESSLGDELLFVSDNDGKSSNLRVVRGGLSPFGTTWRTMSGVSFSKLVLYLSLYCSTSCISNFPASLFDIVLCPIQEK